jgi:hypothetical protein
MMLSRCLDGLKLAMLPRVGEGRRLPLDGLGDPAVGLQDDVPSLPHGRVQRMTGLLEPPVDLRVAAHPRPIC